MADLFWPPALRYSAAMFQLVGTSRSGGQSLNGQEQVVASPAGRWRATLSIPVMDRRHGPADRQDAVLAFRHVVRRGRAATILVPIRDGRGPGHRAGIVPCNGAVPHADEALFSGGAGYGQSFSGATLSSDAAVNATQLGIALGAGLELIPGMRFSMPDGRLHEIDDVLYVDGAGVWVVRVAPWLRAEYQAGTELNFDSPVCRMRLASDDAGALTLNLNKFGTPTIDLVEAF